MTVKELKNAIADAMQTMKENKHTCTRAEKEEHGMGSQEDQSRQK